MVEVKYVFWGVTWLILCFIWSTVMSIGNTVFFYLEEAFNITHVQVRFFEFVPIAIGFILLAVTILIDGIRWYVAKKTQC